MASPAYGFLRAATRRAGEPLKILTSPTHEGYEWMLANTGHQFYGVPCPAAKKWNSTFRRQPDNYIVLPEANIVPGYLECDLVLVHSFQQLGILGGFARARNLPLVFACHTLPSADASSESKRSLYQNRGNYNVFVSEFNRLQWEFPEADADMIPQGVDQSLFSPIVDSERTNTILSVVNKFRERDAECGFSLWARITKGLPARVVGDNPGVSLPAKNLNELVQAYQKSRIFLNTSLWSSSPLTLFEAMSCGCAIVSTRTTSIPAVIRHGENGLISNDPNELAKFLRELLADPERAAELGAAARQTVIENHSIERFVNDWNTLFEKAVSSL